MGREHTDISFATGHKMFEQEGGVFQYVEVVIITLQTKPNHHVDSSRDAEGLLRIDACVLLISRHCPQA
jgi:hypothetical protein